MSSYKNNPLYAILSDFEVGDTLGVCTFYEFMNRLWYYDDINLPTHLYALKIYVKKPEKKASKANSFKKPSTDELLQDINTTPFLSLASLTLPCLTFTTMTFAPSLPSCTDIRIVNLLLISKLTLNSTSHNY